jgi:multiple sugar transport system substrate-binding protein
MPADTYEAGNWNWETFQSILDAVTESGKRGLVLDGWWALRYSWVTNNGGAIYADGQFVAHEDPKSLEAFQWLADNIASENIAFAGSLPEGQGGDAMFMSGQLGFTGSVGPPAFPSKREPRFRYRPLPDEYRKQDRTIWRGGCLLDDERDNREPG